MSDTNEDFKYFQEKFLKTIEDMDIPEKRRELSFANVNWFLRNVSIRNSKHPKLEESIKAAKVLLVMARTIVSDVTTSELREVVGEQCPQT